MYSENTDTTYKIINDIMISGNRKQFKFKCELPETYNTIISNSIKNISSAFRQTETFKNNLQIYHTIIEKLRNNGSCLNFDFSEFSKTALLN